MTIENAPLLEVADLCVELAGKRNQSIVLACRLLILREAVLVALAVAELQRVLGEDVGPDLLTGVRVEETLQTLPRADAHVVTALGADVEVALEFRAIKNRIARLTLDPQAFGDRARTPLRLDARRHDFFEPGHPSNPSTAREAG